jgi:membrane protein implicated in regulation of membrane protease activity
MGYIYLGAIAFGVVLLGASMVIGGKDVGGHGSGDGHGHADDGAAALGWAPITSLRFWVFLLAFGGAVGYTLERVGESATIAAVGAIGVGWVAGVLAVTIIRSLSKKSTSSQVDATELVGTVGQVVLPVGAGKPGKVRVEIKGRAEDYIANIVDDAGELPTGTPVLIVAEGDRGSLLVTKHEV